MESRDRRPRQVKTSQESSNDGGNGHKTPPLTNKLLAIEIGKGKISFLRSSVPGYINHTLVCPEAVGQHNRDSIFFVFVFKDFLRKGFSV